MSVILSHRSSSLSAYRTPVGQPSLVKNANAATAIVLTTTGDTNVFGGQYINKADASWEKYITYPAKNLMSGTGAVSILARIIPRWTGNAATNYAILQVWSTITQSHNGIRFYCSNNSGKIYFECVNSNGTNAVAAFFPTYSFSPTSGTVYDIQVSWDGSTTASAVKLSVNGVQVDSMTATAARNQDPTAWSVATIGACLNVALSNMDFNELVLFDDAEPSAYTARTAFFTATAGDATIVPAASDVRTGVTAGYNTGTCAVPTAANVRSGTAIDATTGTCSVPAAADARSGTAVDATTGTLDLPAVAAVQIGVSFDGATKTGTYDGSDRWSALATTDVRSGTAYKSNSTTNNKTGVLDLPGTSVVRTGTFFDHGTKQGTYTGSDLWTALAVSDVRSGLGFKQGSTTNNKTGTLDIPSASNVKHDVTFDGASQTGTYRGADLWTDAGAANVSSGITYMADGVLTTGTRLTVTNLLQNMTLSSGSGGTATLTPR